jgi:hypothetical protein
MVLFITTCCENLKSYIAKNTFVKVSSFLEYSRHYFEIRSEFCGMNSHRSGIQTAADYSNWRGWNGLLIGAEIGIYPSSISERCLEYRVENNDASLHCNASIAEASVLWWRHLGLVHPASSARRVAPIHVSFAYRNSELTERCYFTTSSVMRCNTISWLTASHRSEQYCVMVCEAVYTQLPEFRRKLLPPSAGYNRHDHWLWQSYISHVLNLSVRIQ